MQTRPDVDDKQSAWNESYRNRDNFVFSPHEEVVRFIAKYARKRTGLDEYRDVAPRDEPARFLDLGCGIGRHVIYCHDMGLDAYGVDLSDEAIGVAREWAARRGLAHPIDRIRQGDIRALPWPDGHFDYVVSHGVLDSMPFSIAREACVDVARVMTAAGRFYCDVISGDDSQHAREFAGEEIVATRHEQGTVQLYFNLSAIHELIDGLFDIVECILVRRENVLAGGYSSRYHLVLKPR
jgi:SAM-dependent methyltransferase